MPRSPRWVASPSIEACVRRCLVGQHPVDVERVTREQATVQARRQAEGLAAPPVISGFTAENLTRCTELYTHDELVAIAQKHGVAIPKTDMGLCARLLLKGLLDPNRT